MREYVGARGARFAIFPGSVLKGSNPPFVMAGELVETSRLWGRQNAAIKPEWAERLAGHLVKRTYSEPHWSAKRAAVMAHEKVTLYGVPLVADRLINFGKVDPALSRELFIRHALVQGEWRTRHAFFHDQPRAPRRGRGARAPRPPARHRRRRGDALRLLRRPRRGRGRQRRPLRPVVEAGAPEAARPADLRPGDAHARRRRRGPRDRLPDELARLRRGRPDLPDQLSLRAGRRRRRAHDRGAGRDPQPGRGGRLLLAGARAARGARHRADPQPAQEPPGQLRAGPQQGARVPRRRARREPSRCSTRSSATSWPRRASSFPATRGTGPRCPAHLQPTFRVVDEAGAEAARGKDLEKLLEPLRPSLEQAIADVAADSGVSATGQTTWTFGTIEESFTQLRAGHEVRGFPALVDEGRTVGVRVCASAAEAEAQHRLGVRRLLLLALGGSPTVDELGLDQLSQAVAGRVAVPHRRRARRRRPRRRGRRPRRRASGRAGRGGVRRTPGRRPTRSRGRRASAASTT